MYIYEKKSAFVEFLKKVFCTKQNTKFFRNNNRSKYKDKKIKKVNRRAII